MLDRVLDFVGALRSAGVPVAVSEELDALQGLRQIDLDRDATKAVLALTLVKSEAGRPAFETLFDLYFPPRPGTLEPPEGHDAESGADDLRAQVEEALRGGDVHTLGPLAIAAVSAFGRVGSGAAQSWYSQYQVVRALDLDGLLARLIDEAQAEATPLEARLRVSELQRGLRRFRSLVLNETRRRAAAERGPETVAGYAVDPLPEDLNLLSATEAELAALRRAIRPLARKLAARVAAKRRRASRGSLDVRRTLRHSLSSGGVPFDVSFRHRVPHRPELFVLCDLSGSVGRFARFALMLTHALSAQFSRVRSFGFVDTLDEVTRFFDHEDFVAAVDRMNREAEIVRHEAHSDYGASLMKFRDFYGRDLGPKATVLIFGDARNNYRDPRESVLRELAERARRLHWLNPEPRGDWDTGDSVVSRYAPWVDEMVQVRNLRQLEDFIARIA
ncbi:MAG TPA: VWA domain-containing protein [Actinomycetota bacterium]|nr:VWA domain-containing protein [Actinomycetota bacterium]